MTIDEIIDAAKDPILELAKNTVSDFVDQAKDDFADFTEDSKEVLENWANAAGQGLLSKAELTFLLRMRADLAEMHALTAAGIGKTKLENFRKGMISVLVRTIMTLV